jgi:tRNA(fMet)-specific endonuclease VapC
LHHYLERLLSILPYGQDAARWHAFERARLIQIGNTPSYTDGQIAAVAATNDLILVTRNMKDFLNFDSLSIENWFEEDEA